MNYCPQLCSHTSLFILCMQQCLKAEESCEICRCFTDSEGHQGRYTALPLDRVLSKSYECTIGLYVQQHRPWSGNTLFNLMETKLWRVWYTYWSVWHTDI